MDYKKAGLLVGSLVIVIALIIFVIASGAEKPASHSTAKPVAQSTTVSQTAPQTQKVDSPQAEVVSQSTADSSDWVKIDEETLPKANTTTEVAIVQSKTMRLHNKELYYTIELLVGTDNLQLSYIASEQGYKAISVEINVKLF